MDGATIQCKNQLAEGIYCGGEIDYDDGLNSLICKKCGRKYLAREMKKNQEFNRIVISKGGKIPMNVKIRKGNEVIAQSNSCDFIINPNTRRKELEESVKNSDLKVVLRKNGHIYNPSIENTEPADKTSYFGADAKETMSNIMAQIKRNTQEENKKKEETNVSQEPVTEVDKEQNTSEEVAITSTANEVEKADSSNEEVNAGSKEVEPETFDPDSIKVPTPRIAQTFTNRTLEDNKGRKIIGRTPRMVPDDVESEY